MRTPSYTLSLIALFTVLASTEPTKSDSSIYSALVAAEHKPNSTAHPAIHLPSLHEAHTPHPHAHTHLTHAHHASAKVCRKISCEKDEDCHKAKDVCGKCELPKHRIAKAGKEHAVNKKGHCAAVKRDKKHGKNRDKKLEKEEKKAEEKAHKAEEKAHKAEEKAHKAEEKVHKAEGKERKEEEKKIEEHKKEEAKKAEEKKAGGQ